MAKSTNTSIFKTSKNLQMFKPLFYTLILLSLSFSLVHAEPTQQYNKILLEPYYKQSMDDDVEYTWTVEVNPPDGMTDTISSILTWYIWMTPTVTFTATVNGQSCNNPTYEIHTTYAGSGNGYLSFDCSNIINQSGNYTIVMEASKNTGSSNAWLDLVYVNDPDGELQIFGTEYVPGDIAKPFLQFLDSNKHAVNDSECLLSVYFPNNTIFLDDIVMNYLDDGLYYKPFVVPEDIGIYMCSAVCYQPLIFDIYSEFVVSSDFEIGNFYGEGTGWSQIEWDYSAEAAEISGVETHNGDYSALVTGAYGYIGRGFQVDRSAESINVSFWFYPSNWQTTEQMDIWLFGGNWLLLQSYDKDNVNQDQWNYAEFTVSDNLTTFGNMRLSFDAWYLPSSGDKFYIDDIEIYQNLPNVTIGNETGYEILRGAGELHVSSGNISVTGNITGNFEGNITGNILGNISVIDSNKLTYAGATEYISGTEAQIAYQYLRIIQGNPTPINDAFCNTTVWFPNNTIFIQDANMSYLATSNGLYWYNFTVPDTDGVYKTQAYCYDAPKESYGSSTFHVESTAVNNQQEIYSLLQDVPDDVWNYTNRSLTSFDEQMWVGGTEYSVDEATGKVVVRLVDSTNTPVDNADCELRVVFPNMTSYFNESMLYFGTEMGGIYYLDFNLTGDTGVYGYGVDCIVTSGASPHEYYLMDTFHVFGANQTKNAEEVWNYPNRTLTYYPDVNASVQINYTYFDENFNQIDNFIQAMNTTMVTNQNYISSLIQNVSTQIDNKWDDFWGTATARITS